jgi:transposase
MARSRSRKARKEFFVQKPQGQITQRVQAVGPERFGIVSIDCAKARSKFLVCDFYGKVLIEPSKVEHTQSEFRDAIARIRVVFAQHDITDSIVAIERTGTYHRPVQDAFRQAGFETRLVHPFTSKQYRQPADPDNKTDDTDLPAIFRAACNGFGLIEPECPDVYQKLQWLSRQRRDLVRKNVVLRNQIHEYLHALMPGYEPCFRDHFFDSPVALTIARQTGSAQAVRELGLEGLRQLVPARSCQTKTLERLLLWAEQAPATPHPQTPLLRAALDSFDDDRLQKTKQIAALEQQMAHLLVRTPYVVLLALPGINVVGAANLAGELGPIEFYGNPTRITGRAGLAPARYQSDQVDSHGPLRRRGNRRLRHALMLVAANLLRHNRHYQAKSWPWQNAKRDRRWMRVKIAKSFSRLMLAMVSQRTIFADHPACQTRHYVLDKLLEFHHQCGADMKVLLDDLDQASRHLTPKNRQQEVAALQQRLKDIDDRRRGPVSLASIIPLVLARLGIAVVQSDVEGHS